MLRIWYNLIELIVILKGYILNSWDYYKLYTLLYIAMTNGNGSIAKDDTSYIYTMLSSHNIPQNHLYGYIEVEQEEGYEGDPEYIIDKDSLAQLVSLILAKYGNEYIAYSYNEDKVNIENWGQLPSVFQHQSLAHFASQFLNILCATYPKYYPLLSAYEANKDKLMNGLSREATGSKEDDYTITSEGKTLGNQTPNTIDVVATLEDNQFVSDLAKSEGETVNSGTSETSSSEEYDTKYVAEKIAEINNSISLLLNDWAKEFDRLFIHEGNLL